MLNPLHAIANINPGQGLASALRFRPLRGYLVAGTVAALGLLLALGVFGWDYRHEKGDFQQHFESEAEQRIVAIEQSVAAAELALDSLRRFYAGSQEVEPAEFRTFVEPYFGHVPGLELLGWVPWSGTEGQPPAEQPPQDSPRAGDRLPPLGNTATMRQPPGGDCPRRLCIRLAEPAARAKELVGLDLGSLPAARGCLLRAVDTARQLACPRLVLPGRRPEEANLLLAAPVYAGAEVPEDPAVRRRQMRGLVVGLVELRSLVGESLKHLAGEEGFEVWLLADAAPNAQVLAVWPPQAEKTSRLPALAPDHPALFSRPILVGGHAFRVVCTPSDEWSVWRAGWRSLAVLCLGLALTAALAAYLFSSARQRAQLAGAYRNLEQARQQLTDEKSFIDHALNAVQDPFYVLDQQGHFLRWNRGLEEASGYGPEEIAQLRPADFFVGKDCPRVIAAIQRAWQGEHVCLEAEGVTKDGRRIPFELTGSRLLDSQGNTIAICGIARDISQRKRNQQQLHELADDLQLRIKQINCLYAISRVQEEQQASNEHLARRTAELLPAALTCPELACARVTLSGHMAESPAFAETPWRIAAPIYVDGEYAGAVDVCYRELPPGRGKEPFLQEEKALIEEVADRLGTMFSRLRAEQRVRELKQQMEFILGATRTGIAVLDEQMRVHYVDPEWQRRCGDPAGKQCCEYFCGRNEPCEQCGGLRARDQRQIVVAERILPKEGNRPVQITSIPFQDEQGRWWIAQVSADITHRKKAEAALRASEARHRAITQSAQDAIITADMTGVIRFWNPAAERIFGFTAEEAVGRNMMDLIVPPEYHDAKRRGMELFARTGQGAALGKTLELEGFRKDGTQFPLEISVSAYRGEDGFVAVALVRDISQRKQIEARLQQARKLEAIGQLAAGIAHEINTPIQYMGDNMRFVAEAFEDIRPFFKSLGDLLSARETDQPDPDVLARLRDAAAKADFEYLAEEIPRAMQQGLEGVRHVAEIVRAMKEFAHPGAEHKQGVDLNRAVQNTLTISRNEWKYVAEVQTKLDPDLPPVPGLPGELNEVLLNLIVNAAQAIAEKNKDRPEEKGTITVATRRNGRWVEIAVADTGTGIPEQIRAQVFNPFFTTKAPGRGTGQGLAIAHHIIVEKHGGQIDFESRPGEGTVFTVRLPLEDKPADVPESARATGQAAPHAEQVARAAEQVARAAGQPAAAGLLAPLEPSTPIEALGALRGLPLAAQPAGESPPAAGAG